MKGRRKIPPSLNGAGERLQLAGLRSWDGGVRERDAVGHPLGHGAQDNVGLQADLGVSDASVALFNIIKAKWGQRLKVAFCLRPPQKSFRSPSRAI